MQIINHAFFVKGITQQSQDDQLRNIQTINNGCYIRVNMNGYYQQVQSLIQARSLRSNGIDYLLPCILKPKSKYSFSKYSVYTSVHWSIMIQSFILLDEKTVNFHILKSLIMMEDQLLV